MRLVEAAFSFNELKDKYALEEYTHKISVFNNSGAVGYIEWDTDSGEVEKVYVGEPFRRLGVGTYLWELATEWAEKNDEVAPEHSSRRSEAGDAYARSIGGRVPDLTDDIDGWSR